MLISSFTAPASMRFLNRNSAASSEHQVASNASYSALDSFERSPSQQTAIVRFEGNNLYEQKYHKLVAKLEDTKQKLKHLNAIQEEYHFDHGKERLDELTERLNDAPSFASLIELMEQVKTAQNVYQLEKIYPELYTLRMLEQQKYQASTDSEVEKLEDQLQPYKEKAFARARQDKEFRQAFKWFEKKAYYVYDEEAQFSLTEAKELKERLEKESPELYRAFLEWGERRGKLDEALELQAKLQTRLENAKALMPDLIASRTVVNHPKFTEVVRTFLDIERSVAAGSINKDERQTYEDFCETIDGFNKYPTFQKNKLMQQAPGHSKYTASKATAISSEMLATRERENTFPHAAKVIQGLLKKSQSESQIDEQLSKMSDEQIDAAYQQLFQTQLPVPEHEPNAKLTYLSQKIDRLTQALKIEHVEEASSESMHHLPSQTLKEKEALNAEKKAGRTQHEKLSNPHTAAEKANIDSGTISKGVLDYQAGDEYKYLSERTLRKRGDVGNRVLTEREEERKRKAAEAAEQARKAEELRRAKDEVQQLDRLLKRTLQLRQFDEL